MCYYGVRVPVGSVLVQPDYQARGGVHLKWMCGNLDQFCPFVCGVRSFDRDPLYLLIQTVGVGWELSW